MVNDSLNSTSYLFTYTIRVSVKMRLMEKYKTVPDKVIMLAMDSVDYDEDRAKHILDIMVAEEATQTPRTSSGHRYPKVAFAFFSV